MTPTSKLIGSVALAVVVLLLAIGFHQSRIARAREMELTAIDTRLVRSRAQAESLEKRIAAISNATAAAERQATETRKAGLIVAFPHARLPAYYTDHPDLTRAAYLPLVRKHFNGFYVAAGLSQIEIDAFESMLAQAGPLLEPFLLANAEIIGDLEPEVAARMEAEQARELSTSVRDLLGDAAGERFAAALKARGARRVVEQVAISTFYTESPLTGPQGGQLMQLLLEAGGGGPEDTPKAETLDWTLLMQRAPAFLSPVQLRTLEAMQAKAAFDREYRRITGFSAGGRLPTPEP